MQAAVGSGAAETALPVAAGVASLGRWVSGSVGSRPTGSDTGGPTVSWTCSGRAKGREAPGPRAVPAATHLHGVRQVELLGRPAELLPGLKLRHRGFGQRGIRPRSETRRCRPGGPPLSRNRPQRCTPTAQRWRRTSAHAIGQPRPRAGPMGRRRAAGGRGLRSKRSEEGRAAATAPPAGLEGMVPVLPFQRPGTQVTVVKTRHSCHTQSLIKELERHNGSATKNFLW